MWLAHGHFCRVSMSPNSQGASTDFEKVYWVALAGCTARYQDGAPSVTRDVDEANVEALRRNSGPLLMSILRIQVHRITNYDGRE